MSAAEIARALNGRHEGRRWRCQCPACGRGNLTVTDMRGGRHLVKCCNGCNYKQVFVALFAQRLLRGDDDDGRDHRRPGDGEVEQRHQLVLANGAPVAAFPGWVLRQLARIERAAERKRPKWLASHSGEAAGQERLLDWLRTSPRGERNQRLFWASCRAGAAGHDGAALIAVGLRLGLPLIEAKRTVESGLQQGARR